MPLEVRKQTSCLQRRWEDWRAAGKEEYRQCHRWTTSRQPLVCVLAKSKPRNLKTCCDIHWRSNHRTGCCQRMMKDNMGRNRGQTEVTANGDTRQTAVRQSSIMEAYDLSCKNKVVDVEGTKVKLQLWDTAGQERFRSITRAYYRDANALLLLYDVTNKNSFDNIRAWLGEIQEYSQDDVVVMLLGNKCDCHERVIKKEDGDRLSKEYGVAFMETSAKTGMNVELAFMAVARDLKMKRQRRPNEPRFDVAAYVQQEKTDQGCCNS
ncbi:Ras-related protein Rab-21 [Elysia marginata]|uniref:Ras-related protein Rab-21 n=1 Tax=Elysia marginata TaxID=1093978 RepID=A0AAV4F9H5_9GAST|nr:Ras-related protein Rab-21 [Elysia marginata]